MGLKSTSHAPTHLPGCAFACTGRSEANGARLVSSRSGHAGERAMECSDENGAGGPAALQSLKLFAGCDEFSECGRPRPQQLRRGLRLRIASSRVAVRRFCARGRAHSVWLGLCRAAEWDTPRSEENEAPFAFRPQLSWSWLFLSAFADGRVAPVTKPSPGLWWGFTPLALPRTEQIVSLVEGG